jgi:FKBP-type peptidyl-prolyl cis-trans isomerase FkpA
MSVTAVPLHPIAKGSVAKLWIGLLVLALIAGAAAWFGTAGLQTITLSSGVKIRTIRQGSGEKVGPNDVIALNYRLHVNKETAPVIQDSRETGQPFVTTTQGVYPGFAEGLQQMRPGGSYILWLPPGTAEQGPPPPGAPFTARDTLVFEIDLLQVERGMAQRFLQMQQMQRLQQMQQMEHGGGAAGAGGGAPGGETAPGAEGGAPPTH